MKENHAMASFAVYVSAAERLDMHGGTADTAAAIKEGLAEGRPVMLNMADVRVITASGAQLLLSLHNHHSEEIFFEEVSSDVIDTMRFIGANDTIINWLQEQA